MPKNQLEKHLPAILVLVSLFLAFDSYVKSRGDRYLTTFNGERIKEKFARDPILKVGEKISAAEKTRTYGLKEAFENETILHFYILRLTYNDDNPAYGMSYESAPEMWWAAQNLMDRSKELRAQLLDPEEQSQFENLKSSTPFAVKAWTWESKQVLMHEAYWPMYHRLIVISLLLAFALMLKIKHFGGDIKKLLPPKVLNFLGLSISFGLSVISLPALAMAQAVKNQKKQDGIGLKLDNFGDFRHERHQILTLVCPLTPKLNLVMFNQNRQSANGASKFVLPALGVSLKPTGWLTTMAVTGPQQEFEKGRVDQHATFLNANIRTRKFSGLLINRFSRGIDGKAVNAHRHIIAIRAGPLPSWANAQIEVRRSQSKTTELFLGSTIQPFIRSKNPWLKGLYVYPFWDFAKNNFDVRIGFTKTFQLN